MLDVDRLGFAAPVAGLASALGSSPARDLVATMWDAKSTAVRAELAQRVLSADPVNIDGLLVRAEAAPTDAEAIALLKEAVRIGDTEWSEHIAETGYVDWWGDVATRPFMEAIRALGDAYFRTGNVDGARACFQYLAEMNAEDPLGVGPLLADLPVRAAAWRVSR